MKRLIPAVAVSLPLLLLSACNGLNVTNTVYDPGFSSDYVYSVGYYNNRPYWGNNYYYSGYIWGTDGGYWGGGYYNGY